MQMQCLSLSAAKYIRPYVRMLAVVCHRLSPFARRKPDATSYRLPKKIRTPAAGT